MTSASAEMPRWRVGRAWVPLARFCIVFGVLLAPIPGLADAYVSALGAMANAVLSVVNDGARVELRFEPPPAIRASGSWTGNLRVHDRKLGQTAHMNLDVRTFSFRPIATFLALAASAGLRGRRAWAIVLGGGLALTATLSSAIAVLATLRFGLGRVVGFGTGAANETAYEALTTPTMSYALPLICFVGLLWIADSKRWLGATGAASLT